MQRSIVFTVELFLCL